MEEWKAIRIDVMRRGGKTGVRKNGRKEGRHRSKMTKWKERREEWNRK